MCKNCSLTYDPTYLVCPRCGAKNPNPQPQGVPIGPAAGPAPAPAASAAAPKTE